MPTKKSPDEIFYVEKKSINTPHPITVGCGDIFYQSFIFDKELKPKPSIFNIKIETPLNNNVCGFNINKISDIIYNNNKSQNIKNVIDDVLSNDLLDNLSLTINFDYFIEKKAPVSDKKSTIMYNCCIEIQKKDETIKYYLVCKVPYVASCPASKEISDYGAHNHRGLAEIRVELIDLDQRSFWIDDLVCIVEKSSSCGVYNSIELQDKAYQTELLYEKPFFIEEITNNLNNLLKKQLEKSINDYSFSLTHNENINSLTFLSKSSSGKTNI